MTAKEAHEIAQQKQRAIKDEEKRKWEDFERLKDQAIEIGTSHGPSFLMVEN